MTDYLEFLRSKSQVGGNHGFEPLWIPDFLFDFQKPLVGWSIRKGRATLMEDCGLGKTPQELVFAENVVRKTNKNILIAAPLVVSHQFIREGEKFGIEVHRSGDGKPKGKITITNYERLHLFDPSDYIGFIGDESGCVKDSKSVRKGVVSEFVRNLPDRLLASATAAPNDFIELGNHSEVLGELGFLDMLAMYFKNDNNTCDTGRHYAAFGGKATTWRFKKHAKEPFWRWVSSWARAVRKPSDIGFPDGKFILPPLIENQHVVDCKWARPGEMYPRAAKGLKEQREELKMTLHQRCEKMAELMSAHDRSVGWCHLNPEGDLLEKIVPNCVQVSGSDSDEAKEEKIKAFLDGQAPRLISKTKICGWGLNLQFCNHTAYFPSDSFEAYYQGVRRFWRFGQERPVTVDIVTTPGGKRTIDNLNRKAAAADRMFEALILHMNDSLKVDPLRHFEKKEEVPAWLYRNN